MLELALNARRGSFTLDVNCRFASEWTAIFGPSGAGKSTLLRLLAGLDRSRQDEPVQGRIVFNNKVLTDTTRALWMEPGQRQTSLVTQQPALFPHLSVAANVAFGLRRLDKTSREQRIDEVLELVGATELVNRRPQDLSGGQAQRIALARALATAPRLLLLDEPFAALDGAASDALLERLQKWISVNRVQAILATHDVSDALAIGAEAMLLLEGRVVALGPSAEVLAGERQRLMTRLQSPQS